MVFELEMRIGLSRHQRGNAALSKRKEEMKEGKGHEVKKFMN